jgi:hypothetical protein
MTSLPQSKPKRVPSDLELAEYRSALATLTKRCLAGVTAFPVPIDTLPLCRREQPGSPAEEQ